MHIIDLTHTLCCGMPVYPGTDPPIVLPAATVSTHGFAEKKLTLYSHTGTHLDAPSHILADGASLDALPVSAFVGPGCRIDLRNHDEPRIERSDLEPFAEVFASSEFVILQTGWEKRWTLETYFHGYPTLSASAAAWLADQGIKGVGMDTISPDPIDEPALPVHRALFARGVLSIENLCNLDALPDSGFLFCALPLKIADGDGAPVRAVALLHGDETERSM